MTQALSSSLQTPLLLLFRSDLPLDLKDLALVARSFENTSQPALSYFNQAYLLTSLAFPLSHQASVPTTDQERLRQRLLDSQEDFACIPLDVWLTPKKLIAYDLDSTLIEEETIDECARALNITQPGTFETISKLTEQAMTEGCDFATSFKRRVLALQGLTEDQLDQVYRSLKLKPGVLKMLQFLKTASTATNSNGSNDPNAAIKTVLISGGMSWFTDRFKKDLGLDAAFGNTVEIQHHQLTGHVSSLPIDQEGKAKTLKNLAQSFHIKPSEIIAIGDGANDLAMIQYAGIGIAKQAKPKLKQSAQVVIEQSHFDFISDLARF